MKVLICDDNPEVLGVLSDLISTTPGGKCIEKETFTTCANLLQELATAKTPPDALFIDIVFQNEDGIETANMIRRLYPDVNIVFITGHVEMAPRIFDAQPIYMLQKPFQKDKLEAALREIRERIQQNEHETISFKIRNQWHTVRYAEIEYIESENRKVHVHGDFGVITSYELLSNVVKRLPPYFARCHQSFAINMRRIDTLSNTDAHMMSGAVVPIAQRRRRFFRNQYVTHIASDQPF